MSSDLVRQGYNKVAEKYLAERNKFPSKKYLVKLISLLKPGSRILDLGCGSGIPIDKYLINKGFQVLGLDISEKQIKLATQNVPKAEFKLRDFSLLKPGEFSVDAVISFYAVFHIKREKHKELFENIKSYLPVSGLLLVTMATSEWEGEEDDFFGEKMWWSHFGIDKNRKIIQDAGFEVLMEEIDSSNNEKHQIILARKI